MSPQGRNRMLFTTQKPFEEILGILEPYQKIAVLGCSECATLCLTGGEEQVAEMKEKLESEGKEVVATFVPEGGLCNMAAVKTALVDKELRKKVKSADAVITFGCGTGAHSVGLVTRKLAVSGTDTQFVGVEAPFKEFLERCAACGQCEIGWTGGICPVTMCSKGLLNGPCGGMEAGKCEFDSDRDCAWVLIYNKLERLGQLQLLDEVRFKDYGKQNKPRDVQLEL